MDRDPMPGEMVIDASTGDRCVVVCVRRGTAFVRNLTDPAKRTGVHALPLDECAVVDGYWNRDEDEEPLSWWRDA